ncbi:MAG: ribosome small subunit-dependent GTPase A [Chloroflexi bacterium]|nr:ribosome small subunit-dependent GTPase A [Chloroflexota bacterium]
MYSLPDIGWTHFFQQQLTEDDNDLKPARVATLSRGIFRLLTERGERTASLSGRLGYESEHLIDLPVVGDWVLARISSDSAVIERVLKRRTKLSRIAPSDQQRLTEEQALATNVDVVFLVTSLTREFNPRRIERYLTQVWESGARPFLVLNKIDLVESPLDYAKQVEDMADGLVLTSAATGSGVDEIRRELRPGLTVVFVGSSGVGKSSLINRLLNDDVQTVYDIRGGDDKGRHTTTAREMLLVPGGGVIIDTPGLRQLQVLADPSALGKTFSDVEGIAEECAFSDCTHTAEPNCAVIAAVEAGELDDGRRRGYQKLQSDLAFADRRRDRAAQLAEKKKRKTISKTNRRRDKQRGRGRYR